MKPKQEAKELVNEFIHNSRYFEDGIKFSENAEAAKQCALICVDKILETCPEKENEIFGISKGIEYWQEVKQEINKL